MIRLNRHPIISFTLRYTPLSSLGCAVFLVINAWPLLVAGVNSKPVVLRGLNGLHLPLIAIETGLILVLSLVLGTGVSLMYWLFKQR